MAETRPIYLSFAVILLFYKSFSYVSLEISNDLLLTLRHYAPPLDVWDKMTLMLVKKKKLKEISDLTRNSDSDVIRLNT